MWRFLCVLFVVFSVAIGGMGIPADALTPLQSDVPVDSEPPPEPAAMGEYPPEQFVEEAAQLDPVLVAELQTELGLSGEEYLAEAAAATDGAAVVESLVNAGIQVEGSRMDGTELTVFVASDEAAQAAESLGAIPDFAAPDEPSFDGVQFAPLADLSGGKIWGYTSTSNPNGVRCSIGFIGKRSDGNSQVVTAGHCGPGGATPTSAAQAFESSSPGVHYPSGYIGGVYANSFHFGNGNDAGFIDLGYAGWTPQPSILTWGGGGGAPYASAPLTLTDQTSGMTGTTLCRSGGTTGWSCGRVIGTDVTVQVGNQLVNTIVSNACVAPGDSGGPAILGTSALGITSGATTVACGSPDYYSVFYPMVSSRGKPSVRTSFGSGWELSVTVATPRLNQNSSGFVAWRGGYLEGTLAGGSNNHTIRLAIAGDARSPRTATVGTDGRWRIALTDLSLCQKSYSLSATWGTRSTSASTSGYFTLADQISTTRIEGANRYDVAVNISKTAYPAAGPAVPVVYLVTGENFPDALSAAPAAAAQGGPLLLTMRDQLPDSVRAEIVRLAPARVVIVGGPNSVSSQQEQPLQSIVSDVGRISGADRYEVSRALASYAFGSAPGGYVATGLGFPDALAASAAAGAKDMPVVLVNGVSGGLDLATQQFLRSWDPDRLIIAGGPNSVSYGIENAVAPTVRLSGSNRFDAAIAINKDAFPASAATFITTGYNFPDALAGAACAGSLGQPLYLSQDVCVPTTLQLELVRTGARSATLFGGPNSLAPAIQSLTAC